MLLYQDTRALMMLALIENEYEVDGGANEQDQKDRYNYSNISSG